jgi:DNA-binding NarL/FixJ family response regulator
MNSIKIGLVDDHNLFRQALTRLLKDENDFDIILEACNGEDFINKLDNNNLPEIVIMDVNMPVMDGFTAVTWLRNKHPNIKVLVLTGLDNDESILSMIRSGVKGYLLKNVDSYELLAAIRNIAQDRLYYPEFVTRVLVESISNDFNSFAKLNSREIEFLKLTATELTYKEIAERMCISSRTVDAYRDQLFEKLQIKSRVGLVLYAIKNSLLEA